MSDYITLMGAEEVSRAGSQIAYASAEMSRTVGNLSEVLQQQQYFMNDWLDRFAAALAPSSGEEQSPDPLPSVMSKEKRG